jgi:hypothetical protein
VEDPVFRPDPSIQALPALRDQVVAIVESINQPQVSIPGKPAQAVQGHLCGIRNPNGSFSIYVGLHLPASGENVVYVHDRPRLSTAEEYRDVELEGIQFLESMGFMLDNLNFRNLPPEAQDRTLARIALFAPGRAPAPALTPVPAPGPAPQGVAAHGPPPPGPSPQGSGPPSDDAARIARLLVSF